MKHPTQPGQLCRIVGSWSLDNQLGDSPNIGKPVTTVSLYPMLAGGTTPVWRVSGNGLISSYGAVGDSVDCLLHWLEVIEHEPISLKVYEKDLEFAD